MLHLVRLVRLLQMRFWHVVRRVGTVHVTRRHRSSGHLRFYLLLKAIEFFAQSLEINVAFFQSRKIGGSKGTNRVFSAGNELGAFSVVCSLDYLQIAASLSDTDEIIWIHVEIYSIVDAAGLALVIHVKNAQSNSNRHVVYDCEKKASRGSARMPAVPRLAVREIAHQCRLLRLFVVLLDLTTEKRRRRYVLVRLLFDRRRRRILPPV